jgi:multidrug resistance efflux pump
MKRPWLIAVSLVALLGGLSWLASARLAADDPVRSGRLSVSATVRSDSVTLIAPSLASTRTSAASGQPAIAGSIASVEVLEGSRVTTGVVVARFDDRALKLQADAARAGARLAKARVGVADANLDTLASNAATLADARKKLDAALATLRASRADVARNLAAAEDAVAHMPPVLPPGVPDPRVLVAKLKAALAQIDAGLAKATAARAKLNAGSAKLSDARSQLRGLRHVLVLAADAADVGIELADARRALAILRAPCTGVVTWVVEAGSVAFAGQPVARVTPDGPVVLDTYLDAGELALVRLGAAATAGSDSSGARVFAGRVTAIAPSFGYPPTSLATPLVHMTRAIKVSVTLDDPGAPLPAGTPADLTISTRSGS